MYTQKSLFGEELTIKPLDEEARSRFDNLDTSLPNIVSYGGGKNSTAMIIALIRLGIKIDVILFADTGGELPETYEYIELFDSWLQENHGLSITIVRSRQSKKSNSRKPYLMVRSIFSGLTRLILSGCVDVKVIHALVFWMYVTSDSWDTLEESALITNALPSKAYGRSSCSYQFKIEPQDEWISVNYPQTKVNKFIGIHHKEQSRIINKKNNLPMWGDDKYEYQYPLVALHLDDGACQALIAASGLPLAAKSSCFFCPNRKASEVRELRDRYPELYQRGLLIESTAMNGVHWRENTSTKGLGRRFAWKDIDNYSDVAIAGLDFLSPKCGCTD